MLTDGIFLKYLYRSFFLSDVGSELGAILLGFDFSRRPLSGSGFGPASRRRRRRRRRCPTIRRSRRASGTTLKKWSSLSVRPVIAAL